MLGFHPLSAAPLSAPFAFELVVVLPPLEGDIDASTVPASRWVNFEGSKRVVMFEGSKRVVTFDGSDNKAGA